MRPDEPTFFVDRSLGRKLVPDALLRAGLRVETHDAHFAQDTKDVEWLPVVGERDWVVLTKDDRLRTNPLERAAVIEARVRLFIVRAGEASGAQLAELLASKAGALASFAVATPGPFIARVSRTGLHRLRLRG